MVEKSKKSRNFAAAIRKNAPQFIGSLAQLVQSIALTRRGSLVRVQQFPLKYQDNPLKINGLFFCNYIQLVPWFLIQLIINIDL